MRLIGDGHGLGDWIGLAYWSGVDKNWHLIGDGLVDLLCIGGGTLN